MLFLVRSQQVLWRRYRGLNNSPWVITPINLYTSYGFNISQASLELSSSRGLFDSLENERKRREKREEQTLTKAAKIFT